nr:probable UDP-N-acetylglucosamine--peptide N-acetylglucosaminyltransferase SPINDLY isoform X2 [Ipomoea batatas]
MAALHPTGNLTWVHTFLAKQFVVSMGGGTTVVHTKPLFNGFEQLPHVLVWNALAQFYKILGSNIKPVPEQGKLLSRSGRFEAHWDAVHKDSTIHQEVSPGPAVVIQGSWKYRDYGILTADWAGCPWDMKSTQGYCVFWRQPKSEKIVIDESSQHKTSKDVEGMDVEDAEQNSQGTPSSREEKVSSLKNGLIHVVRKMPKNAHAHFMLGLMYQRMGQPQKAASEYEKAADILVRPDEEVDRPELLSLIQIHHAECILLGSLEDCSSGNELEPKELEEILVKLKESVQSDVRRASIWNILGLKLLRTGRLKSAISVFSALLVIAPDNLDCLGNLGITYLQRFSESSHSARMGWSAKKSAKLCSFADFEPLPPAVASWLFDAEDLMWVGPIMLKVLRVHIDKIRENIWVYKAMGQLSHPIGGAYNSSRGLFIVFDGGNPGGDLELSEKCLQDLIMKDPNHPGALVNFAALMLCKYGSVVAGAGANADGVALCDQEAAANVAKECLLAATNSDPKAAHIWINLANAYYLTGDHKSSGRCLEKAGKLEPNCLATRYAIGVHRIRDAERSQNPSEQQLSWAGNEMASIIREGDSGMIEPPIAWAGLAMVHKAQHEIAAGFEINPNELSEVKERANYSLKQGNLTTLLDVSKPRLVTLAGKGPQGTILARVTLSFLIFVLMVDGVLKAIAEDPEDAIHWHQLGLHFLCTQQFKMSQKYLKAAVACLKSSYAWSNLGISLHLSAESSCAEEVYKQALLSATPQQAHTIFSNLGNLYRQLKDYESAKAMLTKSLELQPGYAPAYNNLGLVFVAEGKWEEAKFCFDKAILHDPLLDSAKSNMIKARNMHRMYESMSSYL